MKRAWLYSLLVLGACDGSPQMQTAGPPPSEPQVPAVVTDPGLDRPRRTTTPRGADVVPVGDPPPPLTFCGLPLGGGTWTDVASSRDGSVLALTFADGRVDLHRGSDGARIRTLLADAKGQLLGFTHEGRQLITASPDAIELWRTEDGTRIAWVAHAEAAAVSPTGDGYVSRGGSFVRFDDGAVSWRQPALAAVAVRFSGNGAYLVSAGTTLSIWDAATGVEVASLPHAADPRDDAGGPAVSDDATWAAMAYEHSTVLWRVSDGQTWTTGGWEDGELAFSGDGRYLMFSAEGLQLWPLTAEGPGQLRIFPRQQRAALGAEGRFVILDPTASVLTSFESLEGAVAWTAEPPPGHRGPILGVAVNAPRNYAATVGEDGQLLVWDLTSQRLLHELGGDARHTRVAFAPGDPIVVSAAVLPNGTGSLVRGWDLSATPPREWAVSEIAAASVMGLALNHDGSRLAITWSQQASAQAQDVDIVAVPTWQTTARLHRVLGPAALSADGHMVAVAMVDGLRVHSTRDGSTLFHLPDACLPPASGGRCAMPRLGFSPDGRHLLASLPDVVIDFDLSTLGPRLSVPTSGASRPRAFAISPDSRRVAIDGHGIVSLDTGRLHRTLPSTMDQSAFAFARDTLVYGDRFGRLRTSCE